MTWDVEASVSRPYIGGGPLTITDTSDPSCPYVIGREGIGPGNLTWRKVTAQSAFVAGRYVVGQVKDSVGTTLTVRVRGQSFDWLDYHIQQLCAAFEQYLKTLPEAKRKQILANVRSEEPDVKGIVGKLIQRAVDAGFVYASDVRAAKGKSTRHPAGSKRPRPGKRLPHGRRAVRLQPQTPPGLRPPRRWR